MSSIPAQRGWKGEDNTVALKPGLGQTVPAAHCLEEGRGRAPDWLVRRQVEDTKALPAGVGRGGSKGVPGLCSLFAFPSFPLGALGGAGKRQSRPET